MNPLCAQIESEIEARQALNQAESIRGVHEQAIKLVDNMVQNYLGNMRRAIQRFNNLVGRPSASNKQQQQQQQQRPRSDQAPTTGLESGASFGQTVVDELTGLTRRFREFNLQWSRLLGKQQSPLIDRIPPRGVELWRDFWDTVRKQIRRINQEFVQISRDMTRMITGRFTSNGNFGTPRQNEAQPSAPLYYYDTVHGLSQQDQEKLAQKFKDFYDKLSVTLQQEQEKMDGALSKMRAAGSSSSAPVNSNSNQQQPDNQQQQLTNEQKEQLIKDVNSLIDEQDDEATRQELMRNVALRQQIQQEINVFGSIFDIMRAFIQRLRDSASTIRDVLTPGAMNSNDAVTPGPSIKPTVDELLEETINSQRNINGQGKPALLPNNRPRVEG